MDTSLPSFKWFWGGFICLLVLVGLRAGLGPSAAIEDLPDQDPFLVGPPDLAATPAAFFCTVFHDTLKRGDTVYQSLKDHRLSEGKIDELIRTLSEAFNPQTSRPRDFYALTVDSSGVVQRFEYTPYSQPERPILVERQGERLEAKRLKLALESVQSAIQLRIEDNLSNAIYAAGEDDRLTDRLTDDIFGSVIDFRKDPRRGDQVDLLFEKLYRNGKFIRYGQIQMARYQGYAVSQDAFYFESSNQHKGYYDAEGKSLERLFLFYPLTYRRISSDYATKRYHPVLKKNRPHLGIDYAAKTNTPVWSTARGRVVFAGTKGGYGKMVEIQHPNGYRTRYAHLNRIKVRRGQTIPQKKVVGLVGSTGLATGPHLHYELIKNGRHINPRLVNKNKRGTPLKKDQLAAFARHRDRLLEKLAPAPLVLAADANEE